MKMVLDEENNRCVFLDDNHEPVLDVIWVADRMVQIRATERHALHVTTLAAYNVQIKSVTEQ